MGEENKKLKLDVLARPDYFARYVLKCNQYEWQADRLSALTKPWAKVALSAANGSGKSENVIVPAILWHMLCFPGSMTVVTAKQERQIVYTIMGCLRKYAPMLGKMAEWKESELKIKFPDGKVSLMIGFTTNEGARFESFHNRDGAPLMICVDECKEIDDDIFVAVDRCDPLRRLYASSPSNNPTGRFHQICTENPENYNLRFVSAFECPHISKERIENAKKAYGEESSIYRSMILGLPTEDNDDSIFSATAVDSCMKTPPPFNKDDLSQCVFIDWSTGGDEIVVAHRIGNKVAIPLAFTTDRNAADAATTIVGRVADTIRKLNLPTKAEIWADDDGVGWQFNQRLREIGFNVSLFRGGKPSLKKQYYNNLITEMWYECSHIVRRKEVILPNDMIMRKQLIGRKKRYLPENPTQLRLERKEDLEHSPDRADAVIGCIMRGPPIRSMQRPEREMSEVEKFFKLSSNFVLDKEKEDVKQLNRIGINAGKY